MTEKATRRALMIAKDQRALLRRVANIYPGPGGGMDPGPGGGGYAGPGGGKYIGPSRVPRADGGPIDAYHGSPHDFDKFDFSKIGTGEGAQVYGHGLYLADEEAVARQYKMPAIMSASDEVNGVKNAKSNYEYFRRGPSFPDKTGKKWVKGSPQSHEQAIKSVYADLTETPEKAHIHRHTLNALNEFVKTGKWPELGEGHLYDVRLHADPESLLDLDKPMADQPPKVKKALALRPTNTGIGGGPKLYSESTGMYIPDKPGSARAVVPTRDKGAVAAMEKAGIPGVRYFDGYSRSAGEGSRNYVVFPTDKEILEITRKRATGGRAQPTEAQKQAGNYKKDHLSFHGLPISIETPKGATREGVDPNGKPWSVTMPADYGYIKRTEGADGDHVDVYLGPDRHSQMVFLINQHDHGTGEFDEHKVMLGYTSERAAVEAYDKGFSDGKGRDRIGSVEPMSLDAFKHWLKTGKTTKPAKANYIVNSRIGRASGGKVPPFKLYSGAAKLIAAKGQAKATPQQHDLKAKVVLSGHALDEHPDAAAMRHYELGVEDWNTLRPEQQEALRTSAHGDKTPTAPLHSLDVTPQLRDSIKANGFSQFKRGGSVEGGPLADWHWRPVEDVRNELQLDEIPSHVHKFGEFMDETARRASSQGLTPRDLIKAYAITRASIGRRALPVETLRQTFSELPKGLSGRVRPEGAMGHWLHTKMGQRYLDEAEAGRIDEEAIAHAQNTMRRFGKVETEPTALRWAAKNLPGMEGRVSELIARAHRGQSSPEEWRNEMRVPGVAASKAGFLASMLGRGDQPTLDARQIILHTGRPTKEAAPILGRAGAANAAVDRLADRQTQLGFKHDKSMSPFYQHLAHHAIWDKTAGEETTHDDLMQALRGAKSGGRQALKKGGKAEDLGLIGSHPVMRALIEGLPHEAFLPTKHAEMNDLLRNAGVVRPYDDSQENIEKALKIAQDNYLMHAGIGSGKDPSSYYNIRQPVAARDVSTKIAALRGRTPKPQLDMTWEKFGKIGEGGTAINLAGDRTRIGTLGEINGKKLNWPVHLYGGPEYIREGKKGIVWANNAGVATGLRNTIRKLSQRGPVYGIYSPMSAVSGDQAHHMFDAVMAQIDPGSIAKSDRKAFDDAMRSGAFIMGNTEQVLKDRARVAEKMKSWPGIDNPQATSKFALEKLAGVDRKAIIQYLDKKMWTDRGFPHIGMTRAAITDPSVRDVHDNTIGGHVALLNPDQPDRQVSGNPTYPEGIAGTYVGTLPFVQKHYAAPVSTSHLVTTPTAGKGKLSHPFSTDDKARSSYRKLYEQNLIPEPIDQRMVDSASEGLEKQKLYGLKKGGVVDRALALTRKVK